jgi:hypothetical protein
MHLGNITNEVVSFEFFTAVAINNAVVWDVTLWLL